MSSGCTSSYSEKSEALPGAPRFLRVSEQYLSSSVDGYNNSIVFLNKIVNDYTSVSAEHLSSERQGRFYDLFDHQHANTTVLADPPVIARAEKNAKELAQKVHKRQLKPVRKQETSKGTIRRFPGRDFNLCRDLFSINFELHSGTSLSPELAAVKEANSRKDIADLPMYDLNDTVNGKRVFEHLEEWVSIFISLLQSKKIKKAVSNRLVHENRRRKAIWRRFTEIPKYFKRLLAIRLDLSYRVGVRNRRSYRDFNSDYARFMNNLRMNHRLSKGIILIIAKIEYANEKGFHVHFLAFLDGNIVRSDAYTCEQLGLYWKDVITKGDGVFFNGNRRKAKRQLSRYIKVPVNNLALGRIDTGSVEQMKHVGIVIDYFAKTDQSPIFSGRYRKDLRIVRGPRMKIMGERLRRVRAGEEVIDA